MKTPSSLSVSTLIEFLGIQVNGCNQVCKQNVHSTYKQIKVQTFPYTMLMYKNAIDLKKYLILLQGQW